MAEAMWYWHYPNLIWWCPKCKRQPDEVNVVLDQDAKALCLRCGATCYPALRTERVV